MNQNVAGYSLTGLRFALRARWTSVVLIGSFLLIGGSYFAAKKPVNFEASSTLTFRPPTVETPVVRSITDVRPISAGTRKQAHAELTSGVLFLKVIDKYGLNERWNLESRSAALARMKRQVTVDYHLSSETLRISARDHSPEMAATLANAIAEEFVDQKELEASLIAEDRIRGLNLELENRRETVAEIEASLQERGIPAQLSQEEAESLREQMVHQLHLIRSLEARHQLAIVEHREAKPSISILSKAVPEEAIAINDRWLIPVTLCAVGIVIGIVMIALFAVRHTPLQIAADLRKSLDLLLIGFAPTPSASLAKLTKASDTIIEPYRSLRHGIKKLPAGEVSLVSFVSADKHSEMAQVVSNLSVIMAEAGHTTMLIDADLRDPQLYQQFDAANHPGLSDYLTGEMRLQETVVKTRKNNLWFMPSGPSREDPASLLSSKRMEDLLYEMKSRFDYIFLTSPSPLAFAEAGIISGIVDHTVAVTSFRRHSEKHLEKIKRSLESSGGLLSGVILSESMGGPVSGKPSGTSFSTPRKSSSESGRAASA